MSKQRLYHLCTRDAWRAAASQGRYEGSALDRSDGFIHCSTLEQVEVTANRFFAGRTDLVLLTINPARIDGDLRWEAAASRDGELFPHVYGVLPLEAVLSAETWQPDRDGLFRLSVTDDTPL
ncbi:hypothetical protein CKO38_09195 [Rhodospirillum rubrum]|uniref:DUF952 domain-containing protein n=1 Tax=Rhodospirillum rubrum TaxID=1085 RepID=UPI001906B012|nr:DUF952 domain-containing protein [Rhodospirillum rubrum]MBK1664909.1 hypothetical protein [Rhodospirillum rubrum]MBK1676843.1 hypothetical protein [Rhodospirillum rubrum]